MSEPALFNHYFDRAVAALRRGEEGEIGFAMRGVADYLMANIYLTGICLNTDIVGLVNKIVQAQERADWVRLADMLEFELPRHEAVMDFPYPSVRISLDPSDNLQPGQPIRFTVKLTPSSHPKVAFHVKDVRYAYGVQYLGGYAGSDYLESTLVRQYSDNPEWVWVPQGPPGLYRITLWVKREAVEVGHQLDVEDIVDVEIGVGSGDAFP